MTTLRDAARRRMELNPLTTSLNMSMPPHPTPNSALSQNTLSAQFNYNPASFNPTPVSAVHQYNPQQWTTPNSTPSSSRMAPRPQEADVVVPAPPPYSPPRSNRNSLILADDSPSGTSPALRSSPSIQNHYRNSPEPASNPVFSAPPGPRNRSGSNDVTQNTYHVSTFARRPAPEIPRVSTDFIRDGQPSIRRPQHLNDAPPQISDDYLQSSDQRPPASRRAASAGAISTSSSSQSRGSSRSRWEPGMPLPPPPPGPPPSTSRSQSMSRTADRILSPPTRRPGTMSTLGPVPPTPAGWIDEDVPQPPKSPNPALSIDTSSVGSSTIAADTSNSGSSSAGLNRSAHVRGEPKSIRERRTESRPRRGAEEPSNNPWAESITPSDIVVPATSGLLKRRQTVTRSAPRSGRSYQGDTPGSADSSMYNTPVQAQPNTGGSMGSTPRPALRSGRLEAPTPPFSPSQMKNSYIEGSPAVPPKALPTPPPQSRLTVGSPARPVSHILHSNNENVSIPALVPSRPTSRQSSTSQLSQLSPAEQFARSAVERHQEFAQKEALAANNEERVRIFADFIVSESRLRRERYAGAIDAMGSEILELTRDLFRPYSTPRRESSTSQSGAWTPGSSTGPKSPVTRSHRGSIMAALQDGPQLQSQSEPTSGSGKQSPAIGRPESTWWNGYMPSLSPIPSMSVSEALDGSDSRGRPSSRWWEVSQEGGSTGTPSMRMERSKRESKYMGMPRELRESLQYDNGNEPVMNGKAVNMAGSSTRKDYGPNEYPPEKTGWHEEASMGSAPLSSRLSPTAFSPAPFTPNPDHLDVSRLVTLPPPFPRHHPAVNNNHPDLTAIRTAVRTFSDFSEVEATKTRFIEGSAKVSEDLAVEASKRRNSLRVNIQRGIESGSISYANAARMEEEALLSEQGKTKEAVKVDFDLFQTQVVAPVNDLLMGRVTRATELFEQLRSRLFVDAQEANPNLTQEEGDEQPELLEKLKLLKWIFEAREQLHRELYDLLSDRNNRYKDMVITPYRLSNNPEKVQSATLFFAEDAAKRKLAFEQEILKRTEEFMDVIEENVVRGVEIQLSAFWDIAPSLSRITDKIPENLNGFQIQIPADEYEENPEYWEFPMRYLYTLIGHCEKSTYQFIESQTNLLCLLHEVKGVVTLANCRLMRTQRIQQGEDESLVEKELSEVEVDEGMRLTDDLKEKVRCVEELWTSSLGGVLKGIKGRLVQFLVEKGAWEEDE